MTRDRFAFPDRSERGSALLVVLLMLGLIAALAAVVARSVSSAAIELGASRVVAESESDLNAGIELGAAAIFKLGEDMRSGDASVKFGDRVITVRVTNERGRIDLNAATPALIQGLLRASDDLDVDAEALTANLVEWRGGSASQKLTAPSGEEGSILQPTGSRALSTAPNAELQRGPQQLVGTRYFLHPAQLLSVPGFSRELVRRLLPYVTVANGSGRIDPFIAPTRVLEALPGVTASSVEAFRNAREGNTSRKTAIQLLGAREELLTAGAAAGWRLQITSRSENGRISRGEAVIAILEGDTEPYRVVYVAGD